MRSLARERSSSRRAPPIAASKLPACSASSSDLVLSSPQQRCVPTLKGCVPSAIASSFVWTIEPRADGPRHLVAELDHLAELVGGVDVEQRKRNRARDRTPSVPGGAGPTSPCRWSRASPAVRIRRRPRGRCGCSRPPAPAGDRGGKRQRSSQESGPLSTYSSKTAQKKARVVIPGLRSHSVLWVDFCYSPNCRIVTRGTHYRSCYNSSGRKGDKSGRTSN